MECKYLDLDGQCNWHAVVLRHALLHFSMPPFCYPLVFLPLLKPQKLLWQSCEIKLVQPSCHRGFPAGAAALAVSCGAQQLLGGAGRHVHTLHRH
eukprot:scaffold142488_cov21-Tisochrysis_lutea.AAC.4